MDIETFAQYATVASAVIAFLTFLRFGRVRRKSAASERITEPESDLSGTQTSKEQAIKKSFGSKVVSLILFLSFWIFFSALSIYLIFSWLGRRGVQVGEPGYLFISVGLILACAVVVRSLTFLWK